jgi:chemotaxis protein CheX
MNPALTQGTQRRFKPDGSWTTLLETATREVFEIMLGTEVAIVPRPAEGPSGNVMAVVGLAGQLCGVCSMRFTLEGAGRIAKKMLGTDQIASETEVKDAVGEICNMVAGNFKAKISNLAEGCLLSAPTVITGSDFSCHPLTDGESFEICANFEDQRVWVILELSG